MKLKSASMILLFFVYPLFVSGQEDYTEITNIMNKLLSAQKTYISSLESAKKSKDISFAMKEFGNSLKELEPGFSSLNTRYPKLLASKSKMPSDLLDTIGTSEANNKRLTQITLLSLYRYGSEPDVAVSIEELKSVIMSIEMKLSR